MGMTAARLRERRERERLAALSAKRPSATSKPPEPVIETAVEPEPVQECPPEPVIETRKPQQQNHARRR